MRTETNDMVTDLGEVIKLANGRGVTDPELLQRIPERSRQIRERVLMEQGVLEVAVDLIREGRDE